MPTLQTDGKEKVEFYVWNQQWNSILNFVNSFGEFDDSTFKEIEAELVWLK